MPLIHSVVFEPAASSLSYMPPQRRERETQREQKENSSDILLNCHCCIKKIKTPKKRLENGFAPLSVCVLTAGGFPSSSIWPRFP